MEDILWFIAVMVSAGICLVLWIRNCRLPLGWRMNIDRIPPMPECKPPKEDKVFYIPDGWVDVTPNGLTDARVFLNPNEDIEVRVTCKQQGNE